MIFLRYLVLKVDGLDQACLKLGQRFCICLIPGNPDDPTLASISVFHLWAKMRTVFNLPSLHPIPTVSALGPLLNSAVPESGE